jgi:hypothetical protein
MVLIGHETAHIVPLVAGLINQQLDHGHDDQCAKDRRCAGSPGSQQTKGIGQRDDPTLEQIFRPRQEKITGQPRLPRRRHIALPLSPDLDYRHARGFPAIRASKHVRDLLRGVSP